MTTDCTSRRYEFQGAGHRKIVAAFNGGRITSDGGVVLVGEVDRRRRIVERFAGCFSDAREAGSVEHTVEDLLRQRTYGLALGYEDLTDHDELRADALLAAVVGKSDPTGKARKRERDRGHALAGKSTLNRLEWGFSEEADEDRYRRIAVDPLYGTQEGRFFHGYYRCYCYLPLYIFCGSHLLCARLRRSNIDASAGTVEELDRIVSQIRQRWPEVEILIRGDSGFAREELMRWCEEHTVGYVFGLARNRRLQARLESAFDRTHELCEASGQPERIFDEWWHTTLDSWSRRRRVIGKAEITIHGENPRFVVTSLPAETMEARAVYEDLYCARGDMENRIKEQQLDLFATRTSGRLMRVNQVRLWLSSVAYVLLNELRRLGLAGTRMANAQCSTLRLKLLKIGARIRVTVRRVWVSLASAYPYEELFAKAYERLQKIPPTPV